MNSICACTEMVGHSFILLLGILESPEDFDSSDDVYDAVGVVLLEGVEHAEEGQIRELCERLYAVMKG